MAGRRSATSSRSTAATSGSTSACGAWARRSSAWRRRPFSSLLVPRRALERRLDELLDRRLGLIVADGGLGKSSLASAWAVRTDVAWHDVTAADRRLETLAAAIVSTLRSAVPALPEELAVTVAAARGPDAAVEEAQRAQAVAALLCETVEARLARDLTLVLDDVHELGAESVSWRLVEELCRQAGPRLHLLLISRTEPAFALERMRGRGDVVELTGRDLAFTVGEVETLLAETLDGPDAELAARLHEATAGWPAGVRLGLEALRTVSREARAPTLDGLRRRQSPVFAYLAQEVFERAPDELRLLVRTLAGVDRCSAELAAALGLSDAADTLESLARRGLFVEHDRAEPGWYRLSDIAREFVDEHDPLGPGERVALLQRAAAWAGEQGRFASALGWLTQLGEPRPLAGALAEHGERLLSAGHVEEVLSATEALAPAQRDGSIEQLAGRARQIRGDWEGALACFARAAGEADSLDAGIAWRMGLIHHFRGELDEADAVYGRGRLDGAPAREAALLLASHAAVAWLRGDASLCRERVSRAYEMATAIDDEQALATAHTVLAMLAALEGDSAAHTHYAQALEHAERAGDVLQIIRISANRGSRLLDEGYYERSLEELERALRLADVAGFAALRALALNNRGLARFALGRFEEACADLEETRGLYERIGSRNVSYPLCALGDVYRERGDHALSRASYEEAIAHARRAQDVQGIGHATAGLARLLAREDPAAAQQLVDEALACGPGVMQVRALLAALTVAVAREDREQALALAAEAVSVAGARRDRPGLANALELEAHVEPDAATAVSLLEQAIALWREIGNPLGEARSELALARLRGPEEGRALAQQAEQRLRALGARGYAAVAADLLTEFERAQRAPIRIESLGRFRVLRDGAPVPLSEWQSRKARDLLKLLVARRGRPVARDVLMEALWPEGDPARLGNRLSVALSTVRAVLDPDRRFESETFITAGGQSVGLEPGSVDVDVDAFLSQAAAGLELLGAGRVDEARFRLVAAEALYRGDFLEEDAYEDWAAPLREEARATYIRVTRALADDAVERGDLGGAERYLLRTLEKDGYDEAAHIALVAARTRAGRHGDARRAYRGYAARMREIGVEAAPFPRSPALSSL